MIISRGRQNWLLFCASDTYMASGGGFFHGDFFQTESRVLFASLA